MLRTQERRHSNGCEEDCGKAAVDCKGEVAVKELAADIAKYVAGDVAEVHGSIETPQHDEGKVIGLSQGSLGVS